MTTNDKQIAEVFANLALGCYEAAAKYRDEYKKTGLSNADRMAYRLDCDGDRNWIKANAFDPATYPMTA